MASTAGPDFTPFRHCYDWQGRSGIAGRFCPSDQAAPRPEAVIPASLGGSDRRSIRFGLTAT